MRWLVPLILSLSACSPSVRTGDKLIDEVTTRQGGIINSAPCVGVRGPTLIFRPGASGPPALLGATNILDSDARRAASTIAVNWEDNARLDSYRIYGVPVRGECAMNVSRPTYSGEFAFVSYSDPGGEIGAYVFRRADDDWRYVEHVKLGFW